MERSNLVVDLALRNILIIHRHRRNLGSLCCSGRLSPMLFASFLALFLRLLQLVFHHGELFLLDIQLLLKIIFRRRRRHPLLTNFVVLGRMRSWLFVHLSHRGAALFVSVSTTAMRIIQLLELMLWCSNYWAVVPLILRILNLRNIYVCVRVVGGQAHHGVVICVS